MENNDKKLWDFHQNENRAHLKDSYPRQDKLSCLVSKYLPKGSKILEIGFGDGYLLNKLSRNGYEVIGQDLSEVNIVLTKEQWSNKKITFVLGDSSGKFDFKDGFIDGFVASEVLEHMNDEQLRICVGEIYRILKKGGYAFITFPAKENLKISECSCPKCGEIFHKRGHKQHWDEQKIRETFSKFEIVVLKKFVSRIKGESVLSKVMGYLKYFGSHLLNINKSYVLVLKKK